MTKNNLTIIADTIRAPETTGKLMLALGLNNQSDPAQLTEAKRYAASVLAEIEKMANDEKKKDILLCHPLSIVQTMIDAARFKLMIDGRQHCHLIKFKDTATLQIGYRAYLYKIKEAYHDADFVIEPIYEGDNLKIKDENGLQSYTLTKGEEVFRDGPDKLKGILFCVTYTDNGRLIRKVRAVSKARIERARSAAKQDFIWKSDYIEKAKAAAIKAACKHEFASLQALQDVIRYDNENNFDVTNRPINDQKPRNIVEHLNALIDPAGENAADKHIDADAIEVQDVPSEAMPQTAAEGQSIDPKVEDAAKKIARAIRGEVSEQGMFELFEFDFKAEFELVQKSSPSATKYLLDLKEEMLTKIKEGNI